MMDQLFVLRLALLSRRGLRVPGWKKNGEGEKKEVVKGYENIRIMSKLPRTQTMMIRRYCFNLLHTDEFTP